MKNRDQKSLAECVSGIHAIMIAVEDIDAAIDRFSQLASANVTGPDEVSGHGFLRAFVRFSDGAMVQLMQPLDSPPLSKFLDKRGEGLYGIALSVDDLDATAEMIADKSEFEPVGTIIDLPGMRELVLNPRSLHGILTVLREITPTASDENHSDGS